MNGNPQARPGGKSERPRLRRAGVRAALLAAAVFAFAAFTRAGSLHDAARDGDVAAVTRMLVDQGADPNARDMHGSTPLLRAEREGRREVARLLRERSE